MVKTDTKYKSNEKKKSFKKKSNQNWKKKNNNPNDVTIPEYGMLFASRKELWVCNGKVINVYNPVSGSLIEVKEKHRDKVISLCRISDANEDYNIISCDEKGFVYHWVSNKDHENYEKSFCIPLGKKEKITSFCFGDKFSVATVTNMESNASNLMYINQVSKNIKSFILTKYIKQGQYKVALSYDKRFVAALMEKIVYVTELSEKYNREEAVTNYHKTGFIDQHCVAFHPAKHVFATGDVNGCVTLWYQFTNKHPTKVRLHWHTTVAQTICFSSTGGDLYSGGKESVLVRWHIADDNRKSFLPRLGMPIQNVQTDPSNTYVAVYHIDDSISIVNSMEMRLEGTLQRLSKNISGLYDKNSSSNKILLYHPPSASLIKAGKIGYLQFFNPHQSKVNYDLDVTMSNYVSEERNKKLPNVEITLSAISEDGVWLITVEMCLLSPTLKEIVMKFWYYSLAAQRWELNTTVHSPHSDTITALAFSPVSKEVVPTCVSCSEDGKFKLWKLITYEDLTGTQRNLWNCQISRDFRDLPATACAFSQDISLLAIAFNSVVSLWCPEEVLLKRILTQPFLTETITTVIFSHERWKGCSLITRSENYICSWNLLSCNLLWRVYLSTTCLAIDLRTGLLAVFSKNNGVFFFGPQSTEPISSNHDIESEVACAVFTPYIGHSKDDVKNCSTLFYYDKNQNLHRIDPPAVIQRGLSEKCKSQEPPTVEDVNVGIDEDLYDTSSKIFGAFSARTKNVTNKKLEEDDTNVDLTAPSLKNLLKDLHDVQIHNLSFCGLIEHMSTFLPNISLIPVKDQKKEGLKYETIDDERRRNEEKFDVLDSYIVKESKRIDEIRKYNFNKLLNLL